MELQHKKNCFWYSDGQGAILPGGDDRECCGTSNLQDTNTTNTKHTMTIQTDFTLGQAVYLKTDPDQYMRIIVGIQLTADGGILYKLAINMSEQWHYGVEISDTKDIINFSDN